MKKMFFLLLFFVLAGTVFVSGQKTSNKEIFIIQGFDGDKPLLEDQLIIVSYWETPEKKWYEYADKGDTKKIFVKRMMETYHPTYEKKSACSLSGKKVESKDSIIMQVNNIDATRYKSINTLIYIIAMVAAAVAFAILLPLLPLIFSKLKKLK